MTHTLLCVWYRSFDFTLPQQDPDSQLEMEMKKAILSKRG